MAENDVLRHTEDSWRGKSDASLQDAIEDAWRHAKESSDPPQILRVSDIYFAGTNPISDYSVIVVRGGR
jgi:hypothetical protein